MSQEIEIVKVILQAMSTTSMPIQVNDQLTLPPSYHSFVASGRYDGPHAPAETNYRMTNENRVEVLHYTRARTSVAPFRDYLNQSIVTIYSNSLSLLMSFVTIFFDDFLQNQPVLHVMCMCAYVCLFVCLCIWMSSCLYLCISVWFHVFTSSCHHVSMYSYI